MQTANDPPKSPEKSPHLSTVFTVVVSMLAGYFVNLPFDKAKRSDSEYMTKVNDHESRLNSVEKTLERSDERMLNVKASVEEIKRTQLEMLDEIRRAKK